MRQSFRIARIAGIEVGANWSLFVIFLLIAWTLAQGRFAASFPGYTTAAYWIAGFATGILFLVSLLVHELAHSLLARRYGIQVENITLWLFGGIARMRTEAAGPGAEMRIAVIGPATSFGLAALFGAGSYLLGRFDAPDLLVGATGWLAFINSILALFNLAPAFPLDGGRMLRGFLWRKRDRTKATRIAAAAGRAFASLLIGIGIAGFFFAATLGGIWFVFLGWFLLAAAGAEEAQTLLHDTLSDVKVADVMSSEPITAPDSIDVETFVRDYAMQHRLSTFPLEHDGHIVGVATINRIKEVPPEDRMATDVSDAACPMNEVATAQAGESVAVLLERMSACTDGRALVFDGADLVGIISPKDIHRTLELKGL